jgi:hypothetical protein
MCDRLEEIVFYFEDFLVARSLQTNKQTNKTKQNKIKQNKTKQNRHQFQIFSETLK